MRTTFVLVAVFCSVLSVPIQSLSAQSNVPTETTIRLNNENWDRVPHPKVASFTVHEDGSAEGLTETNVPFRQYTVYEKGNVRAQRFEIQDHYHYIVQGEIAYTEKELNALLRKYTHGDTVHISS